MAKPCIETILALRKTADQLEKSTDYQWGHMGSCNCGFLARHITRLTREEIHARAMERHGDWNEQLIDYCPTSGIKMDDLITSMLNTGFDVDDLKHLERLSDPLVLRALPVSQRYLRHNIREDVVKYLRTWSDLLEALLLEQIHVNADEMLSTVHRESVE